MPTTNHRSESPGEYQTRLPFAGIELEAAARQQLIDELTKLSQGLWGSRRNMAYGPNAERLMLAQYPWLRADG